MVELDMLDFDVILGMDWLHDCFASIDCRTRVFQFQFPNKPVLEWREGTQYRDQIISCLKVCRLISKGCLYHIVRVKDFGFEALPLESVSVVKDFQEVFPDDLLRILPNEK